MKNYHSIRVKGDNSEILSVEMPDVLNCVDEATNLEWGILWIWATGHLIDFGNMLDFEERVNESENGLLISWKELVLLSTQFNQVFELILVGAHHIDSIRNYSDDEEMYSKCYYTMELVDSSYWIITSTDKIKLEPFMKNLPGAVWI